MTFYFRITSILLFRSRGEGDYLFPSIPLFKKAKLNLKFQKYTKYQIKISFLQKKSDFVRDSGKICNDFKKLCLLPG